MSSYFLWVVLERTKQIRGEVKGVAIKSSGVGSFRIRPHPDGTSSSLRREKEKHYGV